jgi:hypothetical protein
MFVIVCPIGMKLWILFEIFIDQDTIGLKGLVVSEKKHNTITCMVSIVFACTSFYFMSLKSMFFSMEFHITV